MRDIAPIDHRGYEDNQKAAGDVREFPQTAYADKELDSEQEADNIFMSKNRL